MSLWVKLAISVGGFSFLWLLFSGLWIIIERLETIIALLKRDNV